MSAVKKLWIFVLLLALLLCGCGGDDVSVKIGASELYSRSEIMDAVDVVVKKFESAEDLTLLRVTYDESYTLREMEYRQKHYGEETVIVLLTDIYVGKDALAVGAFRPGHTSTDYQFILTRNSLGRWVIQDGGYA